ncbi:hypothetical protein HMPREF9384_2097 [Streptococcus sanguinis SK160]|uniref:Uncharacterized protein n=1 Tax=Streptococcus sanguinis SK160 TaxID=888812 RepID=F0IW85_STRSA|nr:hypothetical protein HMPREF9384_2097 [Streptococcus sanguinis SK160]
MVFQTLKVIAKCINKASSCPENSVLHFPWHTNRNHHLALLISQPD